MFATTICPMYEIFLHKINVASCHKICGSYLFEHWIGSTSTAMLLRSFFRDSAPLFFWISSHICHYMNGIWCGVFATTKLGCCARWIMWKIFAQTRWAASSIFSSESKKYTERTSTIHATYFMILGYHRLQIKHLKGNFGLIFLEICFPLSFSKNFEP